MIKIEGGKIKLLWPLSKTGWKSRALIFLLGARAVSYAVLREVPLPQEKYLLLIAHPDDESMFFGPTIDRLSRQTAGAADSQSPPLVIAVATLGERGGDPEVRRKEMEGLCKSIGVPVYFMRQGDGAASRMSMAAYTIPLFLLTKRTAILTFDREGVSAHADHKECYHAALLLHRLGVCGTVLTLHTKNALGKYILFGKWSPTSCSVKNRSLSALVRARARMLVHHRSQMLWFRYLYLVFSTYLDLNELCKVAPA